MEKTRVKTIILDHHLTRDLRFKEKFMNPIHKRALELDVVMCTAAEYLGKKNALLEANRKTLSN